MITAECGRDSIFEYKHMNELIVVETDEDFDVVVQLALANEFKEVHCRLREAVWGKPSDRRKAGIAVMINQRLFRGQNTKKGERSPQRTIEGVVAPEIK